MVVRLVAALSLASVVVAASSPFFPGAPDVVNLTAGQILGTVNATANLRAFLGVPYAASTDGANAFASPQARESWDYVLDTTMWGAGCLQDHHNPDVPANLSFDCLNVNVFAPASAGSAPLPVMVFFNGGAFLEGSNQGPFFIYSGGYIASTHDVIVVSANYRLNAYGYAFVPSAGVTGNFGLLDQIAALEWVRDNIGAFGGDPSQVTVWGESAGAMSIGFLMTTERARGLFSRAIMESNPSAFNYKNASEAAVYGETFCATLNCSSGGGGGSCDVSCLRAASPGDVMNAWGSATNNILDFIEANLPHALDGLLGTTPVVDGSFITAEPLSAVESGNYWASDMPVLFGTNTGEGETFIYAAFESAMPPIFAPLLYTAIFEFNLSIAAAIDALPRYNASAYADSREPLAHFLTDYWFRCASDRWAAGAPPGKAYAYVYNHLYSNASIFPKFGLPDICKDVVCHASELPFVFSNVPNFTSFAPNEVGLTTTMAAYWAQFAKTGNPNFAGAPTWPSWDPVARTALLLDVNITTESSADTCAFWDGLGYFW